MPQRHLIKYECSLNDILQHLVDIFVVLNDYFIEHLRSHKNQLALNREILIPFGKIKHQTPRC